MLSMYILVAIAFVVPTYIEGRNREEGWTAFRIIGLLSCICWPAVLVCAAVLIYRDKRSPKGQIFKPISSSSRMRFVADLHQLQDKHDKCDHVGP